MEHMHGTGPFQQSNQRYDVVTPQDLSIFKTQLLQEIKQLLTRQGEKKEFNKWVKSLEVQKLLNISRGKLMSLRVSGKLPYTRIGGVIYYNHDDIFEMLESNKQ